MKRLLNPDGTKPEMDQYVSSTFRYVTDAIDQMANSDDRDKTAKAIADDMHQKWGAWAEQNKAERAAKAKQRKRERADQNQSSKLAQ